MSGESYHRKDYDFLFKFLLVGDASVGKTALLHRYADDYFGDRYDHYTIGCDFKTRTEKVAGSTVKIQMWDTAGQERFRSITRAYYRGARCVVICYDTTCRASFDNVKHWHYEATSQSSAEDGQRIPEHRVVVMLVGTKIDLVDKRQVAEEEGCRLANDIGATLFFETSSKTGDGVDRAFFAAASAALNAPLAFPAREGGVRLPPPSQSISSRNGSKPQSHSANWCGC